MKNEPAEPKMHQLLRRVGFSKLADKLADKRQHAKEKAHAKEEAAKAVYRSFGEPDPEVVALIDRLNRQQEEMQEMLNSWETPHGAPNP